MKTYLWRLAELYDRNEKSDDYVDGGYVTVPSTKSVMNRLNVKPSDTGSVIKKWRFRDNRIRSHPYSRPRDQNRAYQRNDFRLAVALDAQMEEE